MRSQPALSPTQAKARLTTRARAVPAPTNQAPTKIVIPSVARNLLLASGAERHTNYKKQPGGSSGAVEGFGAGAGFTGVAGLFADAGLLCDAALPTVKYLRIFSRRFGPMPRMAVKSSTLLNAPYDLRICKILSAVTGPIPGTNCNSSEVAVFKLTGAGGGFLFAKHGEITTDRARTEKR
jgi:hypothetical protein